MAYLKLCEEPHIVYQGEGPHTNKKMLCLRLYGCDLSCPWCDSKQSWKSKNFKPFMFYDNDIYELLENNNLKNILITGGSPSLQQDALYYIWEDLLATKGKQNMPFFHIEDSGSIEWKALFEEMLYKQPGKMFIAYSPKIFTYPTKKWEGLDILRFGFLINYIIKIVFNIKKDDISIIKKFCNDYDIDEEKIWLMPKGMSREEIFKGTITLQEFCKDKKYNVSSRQHILLYDNKRMV